MEKETKQITVLGKSFNSKEELRTYFREELRKHLPELKKIEGFPIGEDEDILNLSDPPFYTACPNPWLNDFIVEWEEEKFELEKKGKRSSDFKVDEPYAADVSEGKNNPIYMAHSYHTKVPHPAIMRYILHYTQPGDVIFDGFAGTGMTGVAASLCGKPDIQTKIRIEKDVKNIKWGKRNSICSDLSPVASFIASRYNKNMQLPEDYLKLENKIKELELEYNYFYNTLHTDGKIGTINYIIWSDVFLCKNCNSDVVYFEQAVNDKRTKILTEFKCKNCLTKLKKGDVDR
ncbi:MAG: DNA methyltransferase, partial [Urechidicola sp.]